MIKGWKTFGAALVTVGVCGAGAVSAEPGYPGKTAKPAEQAKQTKQAKLDERDVVRARAEMRGPEGKTLGIISFQETPHGVLLRAELNGLPAGPHAIHLHRVGRCEPTFEAAGDHFAPEGQQHGFEVSGGPHAGDLPNIHVPRDGRITFEYLVPEVTLRAGQSSLLDRDGTAVIIHAQPDDYRSQPSGGAGARIACGAIGKT